MKSFFISVALFTTLASAAIVPSQHEAREPGPWCEGIQYLGPTTLDCSLLTYDCLDKDANTTEYIWHKTSCVAAATCVGARNLYELANCTTGAQVPADIVDVPSLSYNIYANIVGECAWEPNGCPITFQNYVDFYYGALSAIGSTSWPDSVDSVQTGYWEPILQWTATGDVLPYTNFNDWLHYSPEKPI